MSHVVQKLESLLRKVCGRTSASGWVYLPTVAVVDGSTPCMLLLDGYDDRDVDEEGIPLEAVREGYPREALHTNEIEDTVAWARQFEDPPSDALLLRSFLFYLKFDAFIEHPDAPDPPEVSPEEARRRQDLQFYDSLGPERHDTSCRHAGCSRGCIAHSVFCRLHHFESIQKRPCEFSH